MTPRWSLAGVLLLVFAGAALAQSPEPALQPGTASPLVPADHWAWEAARQLDALGLAPASFDRGKGLVTRTDLAILLNSAVARAEREQPGLAPLARAFRDRYADEFPDVFEAPAPGRLHLEAGWLGGGYERLVGRVGSGAGTSAPDWTGAHPIPDTMGVVLNGSFGVSLPPRFALTVEPALVAGHPQLRSAMLVGVLWHYFGGWMGRRSTSFGPGVGGGIVLSDAVRLDGFGIFTAQPFRFPWILHGLGPVQMESFFSKVYGGDYIRDPFFVAFRGTVAPHPRFTLGLNRAAMFAGRGNEGITLRRMMFLFTGGTGRRGDGGFANDVLSLDFTWRPPVEAVVPTVLYLEWGMDDTAGMWYRAPGLTGGITFGCIPGAASISTGVEATTFHQSGGTNTIWYRNWALRQGWADYGVPVGHPLAGEGKQLLLWASASPFAARLRLRGSVFLRDRGEQSLFAPQRVGRSEGGSLRTELVLPHRTELDADFSAEHGASRWSTSTLSAAARLRF